MRILVTGAAGFIGYHLSMRLLSEGHKVTGLDNLNDYYDVSLKEDRLVRLQASKDFLFIKEDLANKESIADVFATFPFDRVVHLGAQAGVRYSVSNPHAYVDSNLVGFMNILEGCRHSKIPHLVFASSSSVYGGNTKVPFSEKDNVDHPVSLYAATKKANELMAHAYAHLYQMPVTGLRFFTVYGPWGRPDMALFIFTKAIIEGKPIKVFNHGDMRRDFTYVDDIVTGIMGIMEKPASGQDASSTTQPEPGHSFAPYRIYNIGNNQPIPLMDFINAIENALGKKAQKEFHPMQLGDVPTTYANVDALVEDIAFKPQTPIHVGIQRFIDWYCKYYEMEISSLSC